MFQTPTLAVDRSAIVANWRTLKTRFSGSECAAVVKADAYGLGMAPVATALSQAGCDTFFVATIEEAIALRETLPDVRIIVFHGVGAGEEFAFVNHRIIPVLNSRRQIARWKPVAREHVHAVSVLHIDTAMGRLGLQLEEFKKLMDQDPVLLEQCRVGLIMSHLACSPQPNHPTNEIQLAAFNEAVKRAPGIPASLTNSGGIFLDKSYHFDLARPGCSLYGIAPQEQGKNPMKSVATWTAPILQIRTMERNQEVGYGSTAKVTKGTKIATVASGYADGYLRALSNRSVAYLNDFKLPLLGRVTMDMLCFDVSHVPDDELVEGAFLTLLGDKPGIRVDDLAEAAGTVGYEILTRIGPRVVRSYV